MSLEYTSVATNTVISSSSSVFTFVFSLIICRDPFRWSSFVAAVLSLLGCSLVAAQAPQNVSKSAVTNSNFGDLLALVSAGMFALSSVLLRKHAPQDLDMNSYMGVTGLLALTAAPALLYTADAFAWERFVAPSPRVFAALTANALFGCTLANYFYNSALLLLSPLVANMCLSLSIPLSALTDEFVLGQHRFSAAWMVGASTVAAAVVVA
eukprot:CAMPEP_0203882448 /NCGR_PEP_ID=MMETSP0359-20131031/26670_1 /ASSEMBLY_ACC=CAM_ASM_000338 /TAXON_ID=268821 /ORGANISM="Scrippsiella Hangoei, Strain SHTV-5" /LENGTH=209 /DNA_ID=CAMNT_0050802497 /DNA_START=50 /DNA_END=675 /DNA_ORIENTATION=-